MNIQWIRRIDYWVGIPACFLLSILHSIKKLVTRNKNTEKTPKKVLFVLISELGSTVVAYPAFKAVLNHFPEASFFFLIFHENREVVSLLSIVPENQIITLRKKALLTFLGDTVRACKRLRKEKIDTVIDYELFSRFSSIVSLLSGARERVGFYKFHMEGMYRGSFLTRRVQYNQSRHMAFNFLALSHSVWAEREQPYLKKTLRNESLQLPQLSSGEEAREHIWNKLSAFHPGIQRNNKIVLFNPNASALLPLRKWPLEYYGELARRLLVDPDVYIACIGVASEKPDAQSVIRSGASQRILDLTGETTLRELIDLFNVSRLLVTSDCGPAHIACLTSIPILIFFGPETPNLFAPLSPNARIVYQDFACSPCVSVFNHRLSPCDNNLCLKSVTPETVFPIAKEMIYNDRIHASQDILHQPG